MQYDVGPGGILGPKRPPALAAGDDLFGVAVSPDGGSVYVTQQTLAGDILQFDVGPRGGLAPKNPPAVASAGSSLDLAVTPDGRSVYVVGDNGLVGLVGHASQYDVGAGGRLSAKTPATVTAGNRPAGVAVSPAAAQAEKPGKGCGDKNHVHRRQGECNKPPTS